MMKLENLIKVMLKGYENLLKTSKEIFQIGFEKLSDKPFSSFWEMAKQIPSLLKLKSYLNSKPVSKQQA